MDSVILAHGSGVDDLIVFAHPGEAYNDDQERDGLGDPAAAHGSDLDPRR